MGASFDSRDDRHSYIGYVFDNLNAFVVNLAPDGGIGDVAEGRKIDARNELPARSGQDYDLVRSILTNPVERIDKVRMILRRERERPAVTMKLSNQHTSVIARQLQAAISAEVVTVELHSILLSCLFCTFD